MSTGFKLVRLEKPVPGTTRDDCLLFFFSFIEQVTPIMLQFYALRFCFIVLVGSSNSESSGNLKSAVAVLVVESVPDSLRVGF